MKSNLKRSGGKKRDEPVNGTVGPGTVPSDPPASPMKRMLKKFGVAGFIFFFLKGLIVWILIPLGLFRWLGGCE